MPLPTTRYARYVYRQRKWARKHRRFQRHNDGVGPGAFGHHGGGKKWPILGGGLQNAHGVSSASFQGNRSELVPGTNAGAYFTGGGPNGWPHIHFSAPWYLIQIANGIHNRVPFYSFQVRRVRVVKRKANRMNGLARKLMGAEWFAYLHGWYPDWDPAQRFPQEVDVIADLDLSIGGIYPWGPVSPF